MCDSRLAGLASGDILPIITGDNDGKQSFGQSMFNMFTPGIATQSTVENKLSIPDMYAPAKMSQSIF